MSEEHDGDVVDSERTLDKECQTCDVTCDEGSANNSATSKESETSEVEEKGDLSEKGNEPRGSIIWTDEKTHLRVSWNLKEGTATDKDYVALCYTG